VMIFLILLPLGIPTIFIGLLIVALNTYSLYQQYVKRTSWFIVSAQSICLCLATFFLVVPLSHPSFSYDENGKRIITSHKHFIWQQGHSH